MVMNILPFLFSSFPPTLFVLVVLEDFKANSRPYSSSKVLVFLIETPTGLIVVSEHPFDSRAPAPLPAPNSPPLSADERSRCAGLWLHAGQRAEGYHGGVPTLQVLVEPEGSLTLRASPTLGGRLLAACEDNNGIATTT